MIITSQVALLREMVKINKVIFMRGSGFPEKRKVNMPASRKGFSIPRCLSDVGLTGMWPLGKGGWWPFCLCFSVGVRRHGTKAAWRKKWFVWPPCISTITRTQGRNPEAETEAEATGECCFLVCSFWLSHKFSYANQDHLPGGGTTHSKPCSRTSFSHQENVPRGQSVVAIPYLRFPLPWCWVDSWDRQSGLTLSLYFCNCGQAIWFVWIYLQYARTDSLRNSDFRDFPLCFVTKRKI